MALGVPFSLLSLDYRHLSVTIPARVGAPLLPNGDNRARRVGDGLEGAARLLPHRQSQRRDEVIMRAALVGVFLLV